MAPEEQLADLEVLDPVGGRCTLYGQPFEVRPLTTGQVPAMMRTLLRLQLPADLLFEIPGGLTPEAAVELGLEQLMPRLPELIAENGEAFIEAAAIATREPREKLADTDLGEFLGLLAAIAGVNRDFFVRSLLPTLWRILIPRLRRGDGATLSKH